MHFPTAGVLLSLFFLVFPFRPTQASDDDGRKVEQKLFFELHTTDRQAKTKSIQIYMRRLPRENAPPVILSHAVVLSNLAMRTLGAYLWRQGFDVWMPNMRGHGNGEEMSRVEPYENGDYGFDEIVSVDWPAVLQTVHKLTQKKVHIVGFSMGGMTWEQCLSGVYKNPATGKLQQSDEVAKDRSRMVASFVELTTPLDMKKVSHTVKKLLLPLLPFTKRMHLQIPFTSRYTGENGGTWSLRETFRQGLFGLISPRLPAVLPTGIVEARNMDADGKELRELTARHLSSPHTDAVSDLLSWFYGTYGSKDGAVNYETNKRVRVPTLLLLGTSDSLVPVQYTTARARDFLPEAQVQVDYAEGFAHLDVSFPKAMPVVGKKIANFLLKL